MPPATRKAKGEIKIKEEITNDCSPSEPLEEVEEKVLSKREELLSLWKVASVAQFVSLYRFDFKLPEIEIEQLEDGLLQENEVGRKTLLELLVALLKGIMPTRGIKPENFELNLQKFVKRYWEREENQENPWSEEKPFSEVDIKSQVDILYALCLQRVSCSDAAEALKDMDASALRVQPLGCDDLGNDYWYFYGTRLYKQEPPKEKKNSWQEEWNEQKDKSFNKRGRGRPRKVKPRKSDGESDDFEDVESGRNRNCMNIDEKSRWSVVCSTMEDWVDFAEKFKDSKSKCEKALFVTVQNNFLPVLNDIYQEKERKLQQKLSELIPRNHIVTRRETRQRVKSSMSNDLNGYSSETAHKEHMAKDRARRLEERNRRSTEPNSERKSRKRSRNRSYAESEYEDEDSYESYERDSSYNSAFDDYRIKHMPVISHEGSDLKSKVLRVLNEEVRLHRDAWPFLYPVNESCAPRYYEIISEPMDLSVMCKKVENNDYGTIKDIDEDFRKMVSNCKLYNGEDSSLYRMVMNIWKIFRKSMANLAENSTTPLSSSSSSSGSSCSMDGTKVKPDSRRNTLVDSAQGKGKKKKGRHMEALEMLSRQSELAVEKAQSMEMDDSTELAFQPKTYSQFSDLKIVPIHSHPTSLIEKFMSDSSNQDSNDTEGSNNNSLSFASGNTSPSFDELDNSINESEKKETAPPTIHYIVNKEENEDDLFNKDNARNFNILSDGEGSNQNILSEAEIEMESVPSTDVSCFPVNSMNSKSSSSGEDLVHGMKNILEDCSNENVSSIMSGLQSGPSCDQTSGKESYEFNGTSSVPSRISPHSLIPCFSGPTMEDRNISNLREGFDVPGMSNFSTVDVSVLGISSNRSLFKKQNDNPPIISVEPPAQESFTKNAIDRAPSLHQMHPSFTMPIFQSSPKSQRRYSPTHLQQMESQLYSLSSNDPQSETRDEAQIRYGGDQVDKRFMNQIHAAYSKPQEDALRSRPRYSPILSSQSMLQNHHPLVSDGEIERELSKEHMGHQSMDRMPPLNHMSYVQQSQEESSKNAPRYSPTVSSPQEIPQSNLCSPSTSSQQSNGGQKETSQMYSGSNDKLPPPNQMNVVESNQGESLRPQERQQSPLYPPQMSNQFVNQSSNNQQHMEAVKNTSKAYDGSHTSPDKMTSPEQVNADQDELSKDKVKHSSAFYPQQMLQNQMSNQVPHPIQQQIQVQKSNMENIFSNVSAPSSSFVQGHSNQHASSGPQIPIQVPYGKMFPCESSEFSKQDGNKFPSMKVTLPPSTGEIVLVPGEPDSSTMTFHLYAQPHANPSQVIQSRLELQANTSPNQSNFEGVKSAGNQVTTTTKKGTTKSDNPSQPLKRKSPVPEKQPSVIKSTSPAAPLPPASFKNPGGKTTPESAVSEANPAMPTFYAGNYPPIMRMDSNFSMVRPDGYPSLIRPNAMSVRQVNPVPYTSSDTSLDGLRNNHLYAKNLPVMMPSYRVPNGCGSSVITTNSSSVRQSVQRVCIPPAPLQLSTNTLLQNGNGLYPFVPTTKEEVAKPQNGDPRPTPQNQMKPQPEAVTTSSYYTSANGVLQSFPYQSAPMNSPVFTQVVPNQFSQYPYYIVADPNTFQNPARFSVMQPIPFPNR